MVGKYVIMVLLRRGWKGGNDYGGSNDNNHDDEIMIMKDVLKNKEIDVLENRGIEYDCK